MPQQISRPDQGEGVWILVRRTFTCGPLPAIQTMMRGGLVQLAPGAPGKPTIYEGIDGGFYFTDLSPVREVAAVDHDDFPEPHRSRAIAWVTSVGQTAEPMPIYTREQLEAVDDETGAGMVYQRRPPTPPAAAPAPAEPARAVVGRQAATKKAPIRTTRSQLGGPRRPARRPGKATEPPGITTPPGLLPKPRPGSKVINDETSLQQAGGVSVSEA